MRKKRKASAAEDLMAILIVCIFIGIGVYLAPVILLGLAILFLWSACKVAGDSDGDDDEEKRQ